MENFMMTNLKIDALKGIIQEAVKSEVAKINVSEQKQETKETELITEAELSERLKKSTVTLGKWRKKNYIPFKRISNKIYYDWNEVLEAIPTIECKGGDL